MNVKTKIICLLVGMIFATGILLSGAHLYSLYRSVMDDNKISIHNQAIQIMDAVDAYTSVIKSTGGAISIDPIIQRGDFNGKQAQLKTFFKMVPGVYTLQLTDMNGTIINSDPESTKTIGTSRADRDYFKAVMATGQPAVSDVFISPTIHKPVVIFAYPIKNDVKVTGILIQGVELDYLQGIISKGRIGKSGYAEIVAPNGKFIANKNINLVLKGGKVSEEIGNLLNDFSAMAQEITREDGEINLVAASLSPVSGWTVLTNIPKTEIMNNFYFSLKLSVLILIILSALLSYVACKMAKDTLQHLSVVMEFIGYLGEGELGRKITISASGEMGRLINQVNRTIDKLRVIVSQITNNSEMIAASSEEMMASAEQSAQASQQVAFSIGEVAERVGGQVALVDSSIVVVDKIATEIQQVATKTTSFAQATEKAKQVAHDGQYSLEKVRNQMSMIGEKTNQSVNIMQEIDGKSKQILEMIESIAKNTKQTNQFKQITTFMIEMQQKNKQALVAMQGGKEGVATGTEVVSVVGKSFGEIIEMMEEITSKIQEFSAATQQLAYEGENVLKTVLEIDEESKKISGETQTVSAATEEQSASASEIAVASEALAKMAEELQQIIRMFRV